MVGHLRGPADPGAGVSGKGGGAVIVERVARYACPMPPPTNEQRWDAVKELYRLLRNTENNDQAAQAAKEH